MSLLALRCVLYVFVRYGRCVLAHDVGLTDAGWGCRRPAWIWGGDSHFRMGRRGKNRQAAMWLTLAYIAFAVIMALCILLIARAFDEGT